MGQKLSDPPWRYSPLPKFRKFYGYKQIPLQNSKILQPPGLHKLHAQLRPCT